MNIKKLSCAGIRKRLLVGTPRSDQIAYDSVY